MRIFNFVLLILWLALLGIFTYFYKFQYLPLKSVVQDLRVENENLTKQLSQKLFESSKLPVMDTVQVKEKLKVTRKVFPITRLFVSGKAALTREGIGILRAFLKSNSNAERFDILVYKGARVDRVQKKRAVLLKNFFVKNGVKPEAIRTFTTNKVANKVVITIYSR